MPSRPVRRLRASLALGVLLLASASVSAEAQVNRVQTRLPGFLYDMVLDTMVYARDTVEAPAHEVLAAVRQVYAQLRIPKPEVDSLHGIVSNARFVGSSSLAGQRMSTYFNCGTGPAGANADYWRLSIALATFVEPLADGRTRWGSGLAASARDMGGTGKDAVTCGSLGTLEGRILKLVRDRIAPR